MGDVYRARDPQLGREVAIKVLPTALWHDADRQRTFEREARAAATLNDPNVVAVHDFGVHEGIGFIVTELLQGETLRQRINGRPLPPHIAVEYTIQIASGLAAGHDRGIVHRDIKPENVFVTNEGRIKILDFGLAKMTDGADASATVTLDGVSLRPVMGTAGYMSPEQARGLHTDHRSDIFSAGAVLYEMLAGFAPFRRGTMAQTVSAILHDEPPELTGVAPELEGIVRHCLAKRPEERFQGIRDLIFELKALPAVALRAVPHRQRRRSLRTTAFVALMLFVAAVAATIGYLAGRRPAPVSVQRLHRLTDFPGIEEFPSISPDGRSVAFTASRKGFRQIFVTLVAGGMPVQITNDAADHQAPRWSRDGNSLVYFSRAGANEAEGAIWSIPALGGSPRRITDSIGSADISKDERLAYFRLMSGQVQLVSSSLDGTNVQLIAGSVPGYHLYPRWSPDGQTIAFQRGDGPRFDIFVISRRGGQARQITHDRNIIRGLAWSPDGKGIIYGSSRGSTLPYLPPLALWLVPLNGGATRQITPSDAWYEQPDVHGATGSVSAARVRMRFDIWSFPFDTKAAENVRRAVLLTHQTGQVLTPSASPDGDHIAFLSDSGGHGNLWVMSSRRGDVRQITFEDDPAVTVGLPVWSPDGSSIAFVSSKGRTGYEFGAWIVDPDGRNLRNIAKHGLGIAWSPDGRWLYYAVASAGVLDKVRVTGGAPVRVRNEPTRNVIGVHGTTLYYTVERVLLDGRPQIEIRAATPESGPSRALALIAASRIPSWQIVNPAISPDGEWLAMPLTDGFTTNIWTLSTRNGTWRQVTDFGDRATFIARRVSWSSDGRAILASVGEGDADIVLFEGLLARR
jgi:Tol biopolymer transport system component